LGVASGHQQEPETDKKYAEFSRLPHGKTPSPKSADLNRLVLNAIRQNTGEPRYGGAETEDGKMEV
jgi:hypothetical protein